MDRFDVKRAFLQLVDSGSYTRAACRVTDLRVELEVPARWHQCFPAGPARRSYINTMSY